ncbi:MAG TPA: crossover junction endodeoxyribonuclease RuvC [Candidatus Woesebacteria bacterium]|nr:crossover junction endodeoxyribonuclease RuvC [Candidatus Woesebacteria bacterium]HPJ17285.1 crossover junction endodeoxyribonuclease RuvC [Candidatus Woesebacteria bacterium]
MILGIDPGLANTGWAIVTEEKELIEWGVIKTSEKQKDSQRLEIIYDELEKLIKKHKIRIISVESLFFAKNVSSAMGVAEAIGVIKLLAQKNDIQVYLYTPLEVKMALVGFGRAEKEQVEIMVRQELGLEKSISPSHAADAVAIALTYIFRFDRF